MNGGKPQAAGRLRTGQSPPRISLYALIAALAWTVLIAFMATWNHEQSHTAVMAAARQSALEAFSRDVVYRQWATSHGGVYAPVTETTEPNPWLSDFPERDIVTPSGRRLTLINPAYMTRQAHELGGKLFNLLGHITSLKPIRPQNEPDAWEREALRAFERGVEEQVEISTIKGKEYLRFMRPLLLQEDCLKCHASMGYAVGDIRGGISVSIPWAPYKAHQDSQTVVIFMGYGGVWAAGMLIILAVGAGARRHVRGLARAQEELRNSEYHHRRLFEAMHSGFALSEFVYDEQGRPCDLCFLQVNEAFERLVGRSAAEIVGKRLLRIFPQEGSVWLERLAPLRESRDTITFENHQASADRLIEIRAYAPLPGQVAVLIDDVTERSRVLEELRASEARYRALFEAESDALLLIDNEEGKILEANDAALVMYGYTREEFLTKKNTDMSAEPDETRRVTQETPIMRDNVVIIPLRYHKRKDGSVFPVEITGRFFTIHDRPVHIAAIRDISQRLRTEEELLKHHEQLQKANEDLDSFAHVVSHDLQAPLRRITGFVDLIREAAVIRADEQLSRFLEAISSNARELFELVDGLLEFSRAKRAELFRQPVNLTIMATRILDDLRNDDQDRPVNYTVAEGLSVSADTRLMRSVLQNLLANAWKFTAKNPDARIEFDATEINGERVFRVRDNGAGFDPDKADQLFKPFTRLHDEEEFKGRGIGLSTVARIIQRHGGRIWAESRPGEGATFFFTAPE